MLLVGRHGILTMMNKNKNQQVMKQTAVDFAFEKLANQGLLVTKDYKNLVAYREAKEMEKDQIKNRAVESYHSFTQYLDRLPKIGGASVEMDFEQYYNETFNDNEK
jgi:1,2-phenylacetyl-CoA epoxidase catalytic subunit